jgi:hypothetical protein
MARKTDMDELNISALKGICLLTAFEALSKSSSDHLPNLIELGNEKEAIKTLQSDTN